MRPEHVQSLRAILYGLIAVIGSCGAILVLLLRLGSPSDDTGDNA